MIKIKYIRDMSNFYLIFCLRWSLFFLVFSSVSSLVYSLVLPIREISRISSLKENQVSGYGIVVGLSQTGDTRTTMASRSLLKLLKNKGIQLKNSKFKSKNIAAVLVTAKLPPFSRIGDKIPIWISSIGDAKSLRGGYLIQTPLSAANGEVYAVAQASTNIKTTSTSLSRNKVVETTSYVTNGAIVEKEVIQPLTFNSSIENNFSFQLSLNHFNIQNANAIINKINTIQNNIASLTSKATIEVKIPQNDTPESFISKVLNLPIKVRISPKVIVDPRTGTIVVGENVGLSAVAISTNGLSIQIQATNKNNDKQNKSMIYIEESSTVSELVDMLNAIQLSNKEIIDILNAIDAAGALHGELIIL